MNGCYRVCCITVLCIADASCTLQPIEDMYISKHKHAMKPLKQACNLAYRQLETSTQGSKQASTQGRNEQARQRRKQASTTKTQRSKKETHYRRQTSKQANGINKQARKEANKQASNGINKQSGNGSSMHACMHASTQGAEKQGGKQVYKSRHLSSRRIVSAVLVIW